MSDYAQDVDQVTAPESREPEPVRSRWRPWDAVVGLIIAFFVVSFGSALILAVAGDDGLGFSLGSQTVLALTLIGVAVAYAVANAGPGGAASALGLRRPRRGWVKLTSLGFIAYIAFAAGFAALVAQPEQTDVAEELGVDTSALAAVAAGFLIVVAAPVAEEVFFRGFFFGGLRSAMPLLPAALISGALFGSIHLAGGNLAAAGMLSMLGVLLAWLYERTGSLWAPITLHAVNNALAFTVLVTS
jgi:uncharacterized protein